MANSHEWQLPEGVTLDELTEYAERKIREKRRQYNRDHPEIVKQQRLRTYANFLRRNGMLVMDAQVPAPPWNELQEKCILQAIRANMEGLRNE